MNMRQKKLPIATLEQIDDRCAEFERAWQAGEPFSIESVLDAGVPDDHRDVLFAELIVLEIDYRRRRGETPSKEEYLPRFPTHSAEVHAAFELGEQTGRAFEPPPLSRIEELFPALQVLELLGAGGMGAVYKAKQEGLDRIVALKILPEEFDHDAKFSLRFTREARTLAKLNHPNIVSVYEFGNVHGMFFFLMEFVDGPTLRNVVQAGELAPQQSLAIIPQLCDALQYAHDNGVIHRDIKPENILLTREGVVKIVDFGLSRILGTANQTSDLTGTHQVMGTPRYMAPEQFEGVQHVDHRADIYSLGVVFYELLTGELPLGRFAAPSKKVLIDVRLDEVVLRTLEKEPRHRYQAASEVKSDLQSIAATSDRDIAVTLVNEAVPQTRGSQASPVAAELQGSAARLLLDRRNLMQQVKSALGPLVRWQFLQILVGIALIALGAYCWTQNTRVPHRLVSGFIIHVYGIAFMAAAIAVISRIKSIDYAEPVDAVRAKVARARELYLRLSPLIGFPWWLMWIPMGIAAGFDEITHPNSLVPSLLVGAVGLAVSPWLYFRVQQASRANSQAWKSNFSGASFRNAVQLLDEIKRLGIR